MNGPRLDARRVAAGVCTAVAIVVFAGSGVANLVRAEHVASDILRLGYPAYFMSILGTWKVLGALTLLVAGRTRLAQWAYAGMLIDLVSAAASRAAVGDPSPTILVPLLLAGVVLASSWLRTPTAGATVGAPRLATGT